MADSLAPVSMSRAVAQVTTVSIAAIPTLGLLVPSTEFFSVTLTNCTLLISTSLSSDSAKAYFTDSITFSFARNDVASI